MDLTEVTRGETAEFKYILTVVDLCTKWVEGFPLRTKKPSEIFPHLVALFQRMGLPRIILSDNGGEFDNKVICVVHIHLMRYKFKRYIFALTLALL